MNQFKQVPEKLRDYAHSLAGHGRYWKAAIGSLSAYMSRLGHTWRDDQFQEFNAEVQQLKASLEEYSELTAITVASLEEDASALETYQRIKS